jgi:integrase
MLYRRPGSSRWWGKFTIPGKAPARESSGTADAALAQEWHDRRAAEIWREHRLGERPRIAFGQAAADWVETHARYKRSYPDDRLRLQVLLDLMDVGLAVESITATYLTSLRDTIRSSRTHRGRPIGAGGVNRYLSLVSAILHHAHRREWLPAVPHIPVYRVEKRQPVILRPEQVGALLAALPDHLARMAILSLATGLRQANVAQLTWDRVDLAAGIVRVPPSAAKAGETITVPLSDEARAVLRAQLGQHPTHVFVYRGKPIVGGLTNTAWLRARKAAGVPTLKWHHLRANWATWLAAAGVPEQIRQRWGGWKTPGMAATYTALAASDLMPWANTISVRHILGHSEAGGDPASDAQAVELQRFFGVADGIRTHDNRNHKATVTPISPMKSKVPAKRRRAKQG